MKTRTIKNLFGAALVIAATVLSFTALPKCGLDMWAFLIVALLIGVGSHLISSTTTTAIITGSVVPIINAVRGNKE